MTTLFGNAAVNTTTTVIPEERVQPKKHTMLPVLVVLFLISYGLMTMLIIEQGRTIESQRALIHELFHDSEELAAVKSRTLQENVVVDSQRALTAQLPSTQIPSTQAKARTSQTPSAQVQSKKTPSAQVAPRSRVKDQGVKMPQPQFQAPSRPSADLTDDRRALRTI
ncbi:MAG: hypothetical protein WAN60_13680 [Candidatus Sulfotelmatobacter sp.]